MQFKAWLKKLSIRLYRRAVYCHACGDEVGTNPECPVCLKLMKRQSG